MSTPGYITINHSGKESPTMNNRDEAKTLIAEASWAVRMLAHFHNDGPRGTAISDVWIVVGKVLDSAWIEHQRLTGADVSAAEKQLRARGWLPWRDLYDSSSNGRTDEPVTPEATNKPVDDDDSQRFDFVIDSRGRRCLAVPLPQDSAVYDERR